MLNDIIPVTSPPKKGGGLFGGILGSVLGGLAGAIAAPLTGGASLLGTLGAAAAGAGAGNMVGGLAGEAIDPSKSGGSTTVIPKSEASKKNMQTVAMNNPEVQLATIQNSKNLLKQSSTPDALQYMDILDQASGKLKQQLGVG